MHTNNKVIYNDIKSDNICLVSSLTTEICVKAVIIDFGKVCGKLYKLSDSQKERYKKDHLHIAPDLRDGACKFYVV